MNSIEVQSSGDSSHLYSTTITENLEPGTSLANVIGQHISNERIQPISSMLSNTESNNDSERQSLNELENIKYKTELCRNYSAYGYCSYSSRCQFAHGLQELRCRTRHPKYKTEFCRNFLSGFCKYGSRCQFLHNTNELKDSIQSNDISTTAVAAIGTYLLTNMLAQSAAFSLGGSIAHQSALATLAASANFSPKLNSSLITPTESCLRRTCGIESNLHFSPNIYHGISIPQNQNNNDSQSQSMDNTLISNIEKNMNDNNGSFLN